MPPTNSSDAAIESDGDVAESNAPVAPGEVQESRPAVAVRGTWTSRPARAFARLILWWTR